MAAGGDGVECGTDSGQVNGGPFTQNLALPSNIANTAFPRFKEYHFPR